jgi:hypothetical protein
MKTTGANFSVLFTFIHLSGITLNSVMYFTTNVHPKPNPLRSDSSQSSKNLTICLEVPQFLTSNYTTELK